MKKIFILLCLIILSIGIKAQKIVFENDNDLSKQIESYMGSKTSLDKELRTEVQSFTQNLEQNIYAGDQKENVVKLLNIFSNKRAIPTSNMLPFIKMCNRFVSLQQTNKFDIFSQFLITKCEKEKLTIGLITNYCNFMLHLLEENSINYSSSKNWYFASNNWQLEISSKSNELLVKAKDIDLRCKIKQDSSLCIYKTSGTYYYDSKLFMASGGTVDWQKANFSPDSLKATLSTFIVDTKRAEYSAENTTFYNKKYFSAGIKGRLTDKVMVNETKQNTRYPQFVSYNNSVHIPNITPGIDYDGGYTQKGVLFFGEADSTDSKITIRNKGQEFIIATARSVVFNEKKLEAKNANVIIKLKGDSCITHPNLNFKYNIGGSQVDTNRIAELKHKKEINEAERKRKIDSVQNLTSQMLYLTQINSGGQNARYEDSYHNLEIDVHQIEWKKDSDILYMCTRKASPTTQAIFLNKDYYTDEYFMQLQGVNNFHPLIALNNFRYVYYENYSEFDCKDFFSYVNSAYQTNLDITQIHQMLLNLSYQGFIKYDSETKHGIFNEKLYNTIECKAHKRDYNCIEITSDAQSKNIVNAALDLTDNKLTIYNVQPFDFSRKRMVKAIPDSAVEVFSNNDMKFRGKIQAGYADVYGKEFSFNMDSFQIRIQKADSIAMLAENHKDPKAIKLDSVRSVFERVTGILKIDSINFDDPFENNRSGIAEYQNFPYINITDTCYVYYDKLTQGKYDKEKFNMTVYPFILDSLNRTQLHSVKARGMFVSNIFPDMPVTLELQKDLALGFVKPTPEEGLSMFTGKGTYNNTITLNSNGLGGAGQIQYLTITARGEQFMFYPDSVTGGVGFFETKEVTKQDLGKNKDVKTDYPEILADTAWIKWSPNMDIFSVRSIDTTSLDMYKSNIKYKGNVDITPTAMKGNGNLTFKGSEFISDKFNFNNLDFKSDSTIFAIRDRNNPQDTSSRLYTTHYNAEFHLDEQNPYANFIASNSNSQVIYPQHRYRENTEFFTWNAQTNHFEFGKELKNQNSDSLRKGGKMIFDKDTMNFRVQHSYFDVNDNNIMAYEPGEIIVEDAKIDPVGTITIRPGGKIDPFDNATITCNIEEEIHKVVNISVQIRDKHYYKARNGQYEYTSYTGDISYMKIDSMEVKKIRRDTVANSPKLPTTIARGKVNQNENFMLSPVFMYAGGFEFTGFDPTIKFDGYTYIIQKCDTSIQPFRFRGNVNTDSLIFPIADKNGRVKDTAGRFINTGFYYDRDSSKIYSIFMAPKKSPKHLPILEANQNLWYNTIDKRFEVAPSNRLQGESMSENFVAIKNNDCNIVGQGTINTHFDDEPAKLTIKGEILHDKRYDDITINSMMTFDFWIQKEAIKLMAEEINFNPELKPVNMTRDAIVERLQMFVGIDTTAKIIKDYSLNGEINKIPNELNKTMVFNDIVFKYDKDHKSYRSSGNIGVAFISGQAINKYLPACIEIVKSKKNGDRLTMYFEIPNQGWFFFEYKDKIMYCYSSYDDFNQKIISAKDKDREIHFENKGLYQYLIGSDEQKTKFLRSFPLNKSSIVSKPTEKEDKQESQVESNNDSDEFQLPTEDSNEVSKEEQADDFEIPKEENNQENQNNNQEDFVIEEDNSNPVQEETSQEAVQETPAEQATPIEENQNSQEENAKSEESDFEVPDEGFIDE